MSLLLALHGNPGTPDDFADLASRCEAAEVRCVAPALSWGPDGLTGLIADLDAVVADAGPGPLVVVGYSWGAWAALQYERHGARPPDAIVLVNPYLVSTRPVSPFVERLSTAPVLGRAALGLAAPRLTAAFLRDVFAPASPPDSLAAAWTARLRPSDVWQAALRRKAAQGRHPVPPVPRSSCPILVLIGSEDRVADWGEHRRALDPGRPRVDLHEIEGAGHSLLWTHSDEVVSRIETWTRENGS